jgi:hypothetical protein
LLKQQGLELGRHPRFPRPAVTERWVFGVDATQTVGYALNSDRRALAEYVARHTPDQITDAMNRVCDELGLGVDPFTAVASRRILERSEW